MAKKKPVVDMDKVRTDCYKYDPKRKQCIALEALYCGVEGEKECSWFKPRSRVPMQGTAVSCKFCGLPSEMVHHIFPFERDADGDVAEIAEVMGW